MSVRHVGVFGSKQIKLPSNLFHHLVAQLFYNQSISILMYNALTTGQPDYIHSLINYYTPSCTLRSTNQLLLDCPRFSTEFGKRSLSYLKWFASSHKTLPTTDTINRCLKTYLFT